MTDMYTKNLGKLSKVATIVAAIAFCTRCVPTTDQHSGQQSMVDSTEQQHTSRSLPHNLSVVHAINIGGNEYIGIDGLTYQADTLKLTSSKGTSPIIKGSQDPQLFKTFREGDISLGLPLDDGEYEVTFKFAEPEDTLVGSRVFDVLLEAKTVIKAMDVRLARDGNHISSISRTVKNVTVNDGELNIQLVPIVGQPILHGLVVRKKLEDKRQWEVVWQDEFDYQGVPDPSKWTHDIWPARKVNDEDQTYTDRLKNARVENGRLIIEAHKEDNQGAEYTSARLHNMGKGDLLYGRVDVRAKLPAGQGTWSAAWMLPSNPFKYATSCEPGEDWQGSATCDAWPNSGEIDILEHVGYDMQRVHGTVHTKAYYWINGEQRKASVEGQNVDEDFHLYSMEWTPEEIIIFFDGAPYFYYKNEGTDWRAWPFDHPYHVILNLAIGGAWGRAGGPIDDSIFPVQMEVDYVRISTLKQD